MHRVQNGIQNRIPVQDVQQGRPPHTMELEQGLPVALAGTFLPLFCPKQLLVQLTLWPRRLVEILNILNRESAEGTDTGGKGSITQWVHAEYMEGSETIRPTFTQWVKGGYFLNVPTNVPTG